MKVESNCMQSRLYFHTNQTLVGLTDMGKVPQKADTFSACTAGVRSHRKHRYHRYFSAYTAEVPENNFILKVPQKLQKLQKYFQPVRLRLGHTDITEIAEI